MPTAYLLDRTTAWRHETRVEEVTDEGVELFSRNVG